MTTLSGDGSWVEQDQDGEEVRVRRVQPYEALKSYLCPGCGRDLPAGTGHVVVVPRLAPDLRRHWHRGCWDARHRRGRIQRRRRPA